MQLSSRLFVSHDKRLSHVSACFITMLYSMLAGMLHCKASPRSLRMACRECAGVGHRGAIARIATSGHVRLPSAQGHLSRRPAVFALCADDSILDGRLRNSGLLCGRRGPETDLENGGVRPLLCRGYRYGCDERIWLVRTAFAVMRCAGRTTSDALSAEPRRRPSTPPGRSGRRPAGEGTGPRGTAGRVV